MTTTPEEINAAAGANAAAGIQSATVDGNTVNAQDPLKQLDVANRLAANQAASKPGFGFRFQQIKPVYR